MKVQNFEPVIILFWATTFLKLFTVIMELMSSENKQNQPWLYDNRTKVIIKLIFKNTARSITYQLWKRKLKNKVHKSFISSW